MSSRLLLTGFGSAVAVVLVLSSGACQAAMSGGTGASKRSLSLRFDPGVLALKSSTSWGRSTGNDDLSVELDSGPSEGPSLSLTRIEGAGREDQSTSIASEQSSSLLGYLESLGLQQISVRYTTKF